MFKRKKQVFVEGFGNVKCNKKGFFEAEITLWDEIYDINIYMDSGYERDNFTEEKKMAFKDYVEKREKIQECIENYYNENYDEIIEDFYMAYGANWRASCRTQKEFEEIVASYNARNKKSIKSLLSHFQPQSILFEKNGVSTLMGFVAVTDDHGIAITFRPKLEVMTQDEYYNEYEW